MLINIRDVQIDQSREEWQSRPLEYTCTKIVSLLLGASLLSQTTNLADSFPC
jgi:hypothetical protein